VCMSNSLKDSNGAPENQGTKKEIIFSFLKDYGNCRQKKCTFLLH
jgi:hypothetical protein